jgi:hypothetical protein
VARRERKMDNIEQIKLLAGIKKHKFTENEGSNISLTGIEKRALEKKNNIQPGTQEWFQLWFSRPYLTGEKPV